MGEQEGIYVIGAGGYAKVIVATLQAAVSKITGLLDDNRFAHGETVLGVPVFRSLAVLEPLGWESALIAKGGNGVRREPDRHFSAQLQ